MSLLKTLRTLARGRAHEAGMAMVDANALPLLRQQIRECAAAHEAGRRAVATIAAQCEAERRTEARLTDRIADLETRALEALEAGAEDLARDAAEAIAAAENERDGTRRAIEVYTAEGARLRDLVTRQKTRLAELQRGQRLVAASLAARRASSVTTLSDRATLSEAEETLKRLTERLDDDRAAEAALIDIDAADNADTVRERLAEKGFGAPLRVTQDAVLARLRAKRTN